MKSREDEGGRDRGGGKDAVDVEVPFAMKAVTVAAMRSEVVMVEVGAEGERAMTVVERVVMVEAGVVEAVVFEAVVVEAVVVVAGVVVAGVVVAGVEAMAMVVTVVVVTVVVEGAVRAVADGAIDTCHPFGEAISAPAAPPPAVARSGGCRGC